MVDITDTAIDEHDAGTAHRRGRRATTPRAVLAALVLLLVCAGGLPLAAAPRAAADATGSGYDTAAAHQFVADYASTNGLKGAAYVVVEDGIPVTTGATGDVSPTTPMSVGSVAKSFTAFAVLQLVDAGKVDLDAPVTRYLPDFTVKGADPSAITVRMMLSHTSGLPNPLVIPTTGTLDGDVAEIANLDVASAPGTTYLYSNMNYRTLALLVQKVSGEEFDAYLRDHIFRPLGMNDTTSVLTASDRPGLDAGSVSAYGLLLRLPELKAFVGGAGGVISTAQDMGAWLAMQQRGGVAADGTRLLSEKLVDASHEKQPNAGSYALGWQHTSTADPARIGHDGELTKYSARQDLVPSDGYATAVLLDTFTPTISHPFEISTGLIDIGEGRSPEVGLPTSTIIDVVVGAFTLLVTALGARGVARSGRWAEKRARHPWWRRVLRLLPQAVMPAVALALFVGLTTGSGNPATPLDVFALWPAAMVLVLVWAVVGVVLIAARVVAFRKVRSGDTDTVDATGGTAEA